LHSCDSSHAECALSALICRLVAGGVLDVSRQIAASSRLRDVMILLGAISRAPYKRNLDGKELLPKSRLSWLPSREGVSIGDSRFRKELTAIPAVQTKVSKQGFITTIGWHGDAQGSASPIGRSSGGGGRLLRQIGDPRLSGPLPTDPFLIPGTRRDFGGGTVSNMTSPGLNGFKDLLMATRRREQEIKVDIRKAKRQLSLAWTARALGWVSLISVAAKPIRKRASNALAVRRSEVATLDGNLAATTISVVNFDMDSEVAEPHRRMQAAFDRMISSQRAWNEQTTQRIDRVKARSWAGTVISRGPAILRRLAASLVDTEDLPLAMHVLGGKSIAYFYPGFVLVDGGHGSDFALIDITELRVASTVTAFTETEVIPSDAQIIGSTWAKANKNGSRDRRFAHNRELPVMRYGFLNLLTVGGMDEAFMLSDADASTDFAVAAEELKRILTRGQKLHRLEESQPLLDRPAPTADRVTHHCPGCHTILRLPKGRSGTVRCPECGQRSGITT
jgi:hypothetical protein